MTPAQFRAEADALSVSIGRFGHTKQTVVDLMAQALREFGCADGVDVLDRNGLLHIADFEPCEVCPL